MTREEFEKLRDEASDSGKWLGGSHGRYLRDAWVNGADFAWQFIELLERENKVLREGLEKYGDKRNWRYWSNYDVGAHESYLDFKPDHFCKETRELGGHVAREALANADRIRSRERYEKVSDENIEFLIDMYSEHKDSCQASSITYLAILELQAYRALMPKVRELCVMERCPECTSLYMNHFHYCRFEQIKMLLDEVEKV